MDTSCHRNTVGQPITRGSYSIDTPVVTTVSFIKGIAESVTTTVRSRVPSGFIHPAVVLWLCGIYRGKKAKTSLEGDPALCRHMIGVPYHRCNLDSTYSIQTLPTVAVASLFQGWQCPRSPYSCLGG